MTDLDYLIQSARLKALLLHSKPRFKALITPNSATISFTFPVCAVFPLTAYECDERQAALRSVFNARTALGCWSRRRVE